MNTDSARVQMVAQQVRTWEVLDPRVLETMTVVSRDRFTPAAFRSVAFADTRIPLDHGQEMLAPKVVGRLLQALALRPSDTVLEIGTGTGYVTACLMLLAGHVTSVDIFPDLTEQARTNLKASDSARLALATSDAFTLAGPERYDAIALTGSMPIYDPRFEARLKVGGRLFTFVGQAPIMEARLITRVSDRGCVSESLFETVVPALINAPRPPEFIF